MSTAEQVIAELREAFGPGGDFAACPDGYAKCRHGECEVSELVMDIVGRVA